MTKLETACVWIMGLTMGEYTEHAIPLIDILFG